MKLLPRKTPKPSSRALWQGPQVDGITYSMLSKFLVCRERFRILVAEGLREPWVWSYYAEYGSMFHAAEEAHEGGKDWLKAMEAYYQGLVQKWPANQDDITKWFMLCRMQFPIYANYWRTHDTTVGCKSILQEQSFEFRIPYDPDLTKNVDATSQLAMAFGPVKLRGKIDSAFERKSHVYVKENKTKGDIDIDGIRLTVDQNMQTVIYHLALRHLMPKAKVAGTVYNVIRRPLSERYPVRRGKKESLAAFVRRCGEKIASEPEKHFFRWTVPMTPERLQFFQSRTLNPLLTQVVCWWNGFKGRPRDPAAIRENPWHYQYPFGGYHALERGYRGDYFDYLTRGNSSTLERTNDLFPEL